MHRFRSSHFAAVLIATTLAACGGDARGGGARGANPGAAAAGAAAAGTADRGAVGGAVVGGAAVGGAAAVVVLPGTPPGDLRDWVGEVIAGLDTVRSTAETRPSQAMQTAVTLYVSRQEYIEQYYETGRGLYAGEPLSAAVKEAETRFHALMELLQTSSPGSAAVSSAVAAVQTQYREVLRQAEAAGARLTPRAGAHPTGAGRPEAGAASRASSRGDLLAWLDALDTGLGAARGVAAGGDVEDFRRRALRLYLDDYERIEGFYGVGGRYAAAGLSEAVGRGEDLFHRALQAGDGAAAVRGADSLLAELTTIRAAVVASGVTTRPVAEPLAASGSALAAASRPKTGEIASVLAQVDAAGEYYAAGDGARALAAVERAYLEGFEPLESRLPRELTGRIERIIHLSLRPAMARGAPNARVQADLRVLRAELVGADAALSAGAPFWFGVFNAFAIVVREGLEAVLLIGAILAYLTAIGADRGARRNIFVGMGAGVVATVGTWVLARTVLPIGGAHRELMEGITALLAVGVLLYVSNWLFQKTYIQDWKDFLRDRAGAAATAGSALAMATLAFAAVFREGFETVLFYQALMYDAGAAAVVAGFLPGVLVIVGIGYGIIRLGVRLPLRRVFGVTNALLLYLAFAFVGKGVYNLQEAGLFAPHPVAWLPSVPALTQLFGFYPIVETLLAQLAFLALLAATYAWYQRRLPAHVTALRRARDRRTQADAA